MAAGEAIARVTTHGIVRLAVLPALLFAAFTTSPEFVHYSTELVPGLLLALAVLAMARQCVTPGRWNLWTAALLLGAVPYAKLQAGPVALVLGLMLLGVELSARRWGDLLRGDHRRRVSNPAGGGSGGGHRAD